jgi:hypothetical protein
MARPDTNFALKREIRIKIPEELDRWFVELDGARAQMDREDIRILKSAVLRTLRRGKGMVE